MRDRMIHIEASNLQTEDSTDDQVVTQDATETLDRSSNIEKVLEPTRVVKKGGISRKLSKHSKKKLRNEAEESRKRQLGSPGPAKNIASGYSSQLGLPKITVD